MGLGQFLAPGGSAVPGQSGFGAGPANLFQVFHPNQDDRWHLASDRDVRSLRPVMRAAHTRLKCEAAIGSRIALAEPLKE